MTGIFTVIFVLFLKHNWLFLILTILNLSQPSCEEHIPAVNSPAILENADSLTEGNDTEIVEINGSTLYDICNFFGISQNRCSCAVTIQLCPFENTLERELNITGIHYMRSSIFTLIYVSLSTIVSLFGLAGNALVLFVAFYQRLKLPSNKLHIVELAIINFVFSLLQIINATPLFWTNKWIYGMFMCKFIRTMLEMCTILSIVYIMIIAVERFVLILYPNKSSDLERIIKHKVVLVVIFFTIISVIPFFIGSCIEESGRCVQFGCRYKNWLLPYSWFVLVLYFFLPGITVMLAYVTIATYISRQVSTLDYSHNELLHERKMKRNRRVVYITLIILFCFLICSLPTRASLIFIETRRKKSGDEEIHMDPNLYFTLTFLSYITYPFQSIVNPILYSIIDSEWRRELKNCYRNLVFKVLNEKESAYNDACIVNSHMNYDFHTEDTGLQSLTSSSVDNEHNQMIHESFL